ncbi:uncharacterized protein F4822DRAFT_272460 [Hypoxylon trugodes]|uniref:uncharacterized protein n=1 Tax=Hypoxylon trugodes TaxID=326681 RepID=UPI00219415CC|nr:uncharacterized protein F4822DRAFT_272460 [Hypoxylon trugodes]KAI1389194.1 hypothetical protein F4822DRAFT_272460 [Hypoxylon trugodes]
MGRVWSCSSCVGFMVLAILVPRTIAIQTDEYQVHQIDKNDFIRHPKRDASCQQTGWSLCPASANGGCCPTGYSCAESSCYATTAGPTSGCGTEGYYDCPLTAGPGNCCPVGFICGRERCEAPAGASKATSCSPSYFACTASPYGCCPNGMACGISTCYSTNPETFQVSGTVTTTNSKGDTITTIVTSTTVITPGPDASDSSAATQGVAKLIPSTVSKLPAVGTDSSNSGSTNSGGGGGGDGNLSQSQLGGIIGGAVAILVIIIIVAVVIIWRLKRAEKAAQAIAQSRKESSSGQPRSQKSGFGQPSVSEVDGMDAESVLRARHMHYRTRSDSPTVGGRSRSETPNMYGTNASSTPQGGPTSIAQLPGSDASDGRQSSMDSYGPRHDNVPFAQRPSVDSQGSYPHTHTRQWSNVSELDGSIGSAHGVSELGTPDADEDARRRSNSTTRAPKGHIRRTSDPSSNNTTRGVQGDNGASTMPLGPLHEFDELHGYYGASDHTGQTAARLHTKSSSISSAPE